MADENGTRRSWLEWALGIFVAISAFLSIMAWNGVNARAQNHEDAVQRLEKRVNKTEVDGGVTAAHVGDLIHTFNTTIADHTAAINTLTKSVNDLTIASRRRR